MPRKSYLRTAEDCQLSLSRFLGSCTVPCKDWSLGPGEPPRRQLAAHATHQHHSIQQKRHLNRHEDASSCMSALVAILKAITPLGYGARRTILTRTIPTRPIPPRTILTMNDPKRQRVDGHKRIIIPLLHGASRTRQTNFEKLLPSSASHDSFRLESVFHLRVQLSRSE